MGSAGSSPANMHPKLGNGQQLVAALQEQWANIPQDSIGRLIRSNAQALYVRCSSTRWPYPIGTIVRLPYLEPPSCDCHGRLLLCIFMVIRPGMSGLVSNVFRFFWKGVGKVQVGSNIAPNHSSSPWEVLWSFAPIHIQNQPKVKLGKVIICSKLV